MIKAVSGNIARKLAEELQCGEEKTEIFQYGLQIILGTSLKLALILLLSIILNTFYTTLICLTTYIAFRSFGGGVHLSTYSRCLVTGLAMFTIFGKLAAYAIETRILLFLLITVLLLWIYAIIKWVPVGTEKKQVRDANACLKQKQKTAGVLVLWCMACTALIRYNLTCYAFASLLGAWASLLLITPWGYGAVKALDNILDTLGKGGVKACTGRR